MTKVGILIMTMILAIRLPVASAQEAQDPIDKNLDACLNSPEGVSTVGQQACASTAYEAWDRELNQVFQKLMKNLDPTSRDLLRASQRQWLQFRDSEKKFQAAPWRQKGGTLIGVSVNLDNIDALRTRVRALRSYAAVAK